MSPSQPTPKTWKSDTHLLWRQAGKEQGGSPKGNCSKVHQPKLGKEEEFTGCLQAAKSFCRYCRLPSFIFQLQKPPGHSRGSPDHSGQMAFDLSQDSPQLHCHEGTRRKQQRKATTFPPFPGQEQCEPP